MKVEHKPATAGGARPAKTSGRKEPVLWAAVFLVIVLALLFWRSLDPAYVLFSNDGPLGGMVAEHNRMPSILKGVWADVNWLGNEGLSPSPGITTAMRLVTTPFIYGRILCPASLFIVGICAAFCLRQFKLAPIACILGGLAAALNSDFLSTSCWGVASQIVGFGANYLALGLLANDSPRRRWVRVILAGMAVGIGIMEAYDIGALFSLFVAAFALHRALFLSEGPWPVNFRRGTARIAVVALFAAYISAHSLTVLIGTQLEGIVGAQQDQKTKEHRWAEATQWSLPKAETAQLFIPGIFGYRLDSPNGLNYWGTIGASPSIPELQKILADPQASQDMKNFATGELAKGGTWRFSGTGIYAGLLVVILALWTVLQSFRARGSPYSRFQRRSIWFWTAVLAICLPFAFGKYAPFYQFFYALPYASAIRNPVKFMHVFSWALVILFAYGVHGLYRVYMENPITPARGVVAQFKRWFAKASPFERTWMTGSFCAVGFGLIGWWIYGVGNQRLLAYMLATGMDASVAPTTAHYSLETMGWFCLFLGLVVGLLALIFSGQFTGRRARLGGILLGALLVLNLGRADEPWIIYWNIAYKYATNPIIDILREKPYEHRVDVLPYGSHGEQINFFHQEYSIEWHQQLFPYYNIQSMGMVMEPRVTIDKDLFVAALPYPPNPAATPFSMMRAWELTNTRYLLGDGGPLVDFLNQQVDPAQKRFRLVQGFEMVAKPGSPATALTDYTAEKNPNGALGLIEFTGALPRAGLYSNWQINTNDEAVLHMLGDRAFNPHKLVLVSDAGVPPPAPADTNQPAGAVEITSYKSKRIELQAEVKTPAILLLIERYNPKWQVEVDGQPARLLRCNFIMRGVQLKPGAHKIVLRFVSPVLTLYVSLSAIVLGLALCAWLAWDNRPAEDAEPAEKNEET